MFRAVNCWQSGLQHRPKVVAISEKCRFSWSIFYDAKCVKTLSFSATESKKKDTGQE